MATLPLSDDNLSQPGIREYRRRLAATSPAERLGRTVKLCNLTRDFVKSGILNRNPGINQQELQIRYAAITLGADFIMRRYGWDVTKKGY